MTVKELIKEWLEEAGEPEFANVINAKLNENEFAEKEVGADVDAGPIRYAESWGHETGFVSLNCERLH